MGADSTGPASINDTLLRRTLTLTAIKLCRRWRPRSSKVLFLTSKICVKYGYYQNVSEAATMQFIAGKTSIPVPKVYCAFRHKDFTYIVMERIDGESLGHRWRQRSKDSQAEILQQLKAMVDEMRSIPAPKNMGVASVNGGSIYDGRLPEDRPRLRFGPFKDTVEFHHYLRRGMEAHTCPHSYSDLNALIDMHQGEWPLCFTHGDLSSLNILARGDKIVGIVDWETAGWYPSYWEYTSTWNVNPQNSFWRDEVDKFLDPMPKELEMELIRQKYFGEFGL